MNMQTAPGKFHSGSLFLIALLWSGACSSSDSSSVRPDNLDPSVSSVSAASPQAFAKLIDRELAALQPHLRRHQGQIVLGQNQLELIASPVPPLTGGSTFYPILTRLYKATGKTWLQQTWQPQLEISISTSSGEALSMIGQDIEHRDNQPHVIAYFRGPTAAMGQARLDLEWLNENATVKATVTQQGGSAPLRWQLRLPAGWGEEHLIPVDQERFLGLTVSLLPDVFTVLSTTPVDIKSDKKQTQFGATEIAADGSRFFLLFGRAAALQQAALVAQLKKSPKSSEAWQIQLPARQPAPRSEKRLFQPLFVHDDKGGFVSTVPIYEGEQLKWNLPIDQNWEVLYPDSQGVLQKLAFDRESRSAQLPALALGSFQLDLKPGRPGFVEIRDAVRRDSISWAAQLAHRPADILNAHDFLQKTWPLAASLPAGDYQLQISDGMDRLCLQSFTILPGKHQTITCSSESSKPTLSMRANLSFDGNSWSDELLQASRFQAIGRLVRGGKDEDPHLNEIPMIMAEDLNLGLSLRAFPADENLRKAWLSARPKDNEALLPAFAKFARESHPPLQVVLECPDANVSLEEYRWLALTIQPDIVEVFGCQKTDRVEELLQVAHKLQQKSAKAIKLAAAAPFAGRTPGSEFIPALYVNGKPENLIHALSSGDYSLGLRSEIATSGPLPVLGETAVQSLTVQIRSYDLKDQSALIRILDQDMQLTEQAIAPTRDHEQTLHINLRLRPSSRFLRIELLSQGLTADASQDGWAQPFLLATSNFLGLNGPP